MQSFRHIIHVHVHTYMYFMYYRCMHICLVNLPWIYSHVSRDTHWPLCSTLPPAPCRVRKWPLRSRSCHQRQSSLTQWERRCSREQWGLPSSGPSLMDEAKNWSHCLENSSTSLMWMGEIDKPLLLLNPALGVRQNVVPSNYGIRGLD